MKEKILIKGMNQKELKNLCEINAFPNFHGEQIFRWMYKQKCDDVHQMKNIPKKLIDYLK